MCKLLKEKTKLKLSAKIVHDLKKNKKYLVNYTKRQLLTKKVTTIFISIHAIKVKSIQSYFSVVFSGTSSDDLENLSIIVFHKPFFSSSIC